LERVEKSDSPVVEKASYQLDFPNSSWPLPWPVHYIRIKPLLVGRSRTVYSFNGVMVVEGHRFWTRPDGDRARVLLEQAVDPFCSSLFLQCI
jgi:hypothetical protein